jgi:hypothetical protein
MTKSRNPDKPTITRNTTLAARRRRQGRRGGAGTDKAATPNPETLAREQLRAGLYFADASAAGEPEKVHWFWKALLIALPLYYFLAFGRFGFGERDDGFVLGYSWRILLGQLPHRDFISVRPTMFAYVHALSLLLMPESLEMIFDRLLNYSMMAASNFFLFAALDRWLPLRRLHLNVYAMAAIGFVYSMHNWPPMAWTSTDGVFFFLLGLYLMTRGSDLRWLAGGMLAVLAGQLTKQSFILMPPMALIVVWVLYGRRAALQALGVLAGASAALTLWGAAVGVLGPMIEQTTNTYGRPNLFLYSGLLPYLERWIYFVPVVLFFVLRRVVIRHPDLARRAAAVLAAAICLAMFYETLDNYLVTQILFRRLAAKLSFGLVASGYAKATWAQVWNEFFHHPSWGDTGMGFNIPYHGVRTLFWLGLGIALATLQIRKVPGSILPLYGLALGWSCSATNGYPTPAFCSGPLVFALFHAGMGILDRRATKVLVHLLLWGGLVVYSFANCFPYQSKPIWRCTHQMGDLFPKASHIWCDNRSWDVYSELRELVDRYGPNFKTLPNVPLANYLTSTKPPIPLDWVSDYELPGEWRDIALDLDRSGATVFVRKELMEAELLPYYQFGGMNSTVTYYVTKTWKKVATGKCFDVYQRDTSTSSPLELQWKKAR